MVTGTDREQAAEPDGRTALTHTDVATMPLVATQRRVLVVDDDPGIRGFVMTVLRAEGYEVVSAVNGHMALECAGLHRPDLVLLDLSMPVMNGWEFHAAFRLLYPDVPVVYMTAGYSARVEAEQHGAAGYLAKPFEVEHLLAIAGRLAPMPRVDGA